MGLSGRVDTWLNDPTSQKCAQFNVFVFVPSIWRFGSGQVVFDPFLFFKMFHFDHKGKVILIKDVLYLYLEKIFLLWYLSCLTGPIMAVAYAHITTMHSTALPLRKVQCSVGIAHFMCILLVWHHNTTKKCRMQNRCISQQYSPPITQCTVHKCNFMCIFLLWLHHHKRCK